MKNTSKTLNVKGLNTPRFFVWIKGFVHGKILHTGGLDPETEKISSGYITGQVKRYREACVDCKSITQGSLKDSWAEADKLIYEYSYLTASLSKEFSVPNDEILSNALLRKMEKQEDDLSKRESERHSKVLALSKIRNRIIDETEHAHNQMEATLEALMSVFSCYGHGLLMRPVYSKNLPAVPFDEYTNSIIDGKHEQTWKSMCSILDKEES